MSESPEQTEPVAQPFRYTSPPMGEGTVVGKTVVRLARTDRMMANVQVLRSGGETNLHTHHHLDGFWMVLKGCARFYGEGDVVVAELKALEGVLIPRHFKYWFESVGDETLELLQVECSDIALPHDRAVRQDRQDFAPRAGATRNITIIDARINSAEYGKSRKLDMQAAD